MTMSNWTVTVNCSHMRPLCMNPLRWLGIHGNPAVQRAAFHSQSHTLSLVPSLAIYLGNSNLQDHCFPPLTMLSQPSQDMYVHVCAHTLAVHPHLHTMLIVHTYIVCIYIYYIILYSGTMHIYVHVFMCIYNMYGFVSPCKEKCVCWTFPSFV